MWSKGEKRRRFTETTLFKTRICEIVYPVQDRGPWKLDTLTVGTTLYRKYMGAPPPRGGMASMVPITREWWWIWISYTILQTGTHSKCFLARICPVWQAQPCRHLHCCTCWLLCMCSGINSGTQPDRTVDISCILWHTPKGFTWVKQMFSESNDINKDSTLSQAPQRVLVSPVILLILFRGFQNKITLTNAQKRTIPSTYAKWCPKKQFEGRIQSPVWVSRWLVKCRFCA